MNRTKKNLEKLTIGDWYQEIELANTRANVIYSALGHPYSWSRKEGTIEKTINKLAEGALKTLQERKTDESYHMTGGIKVEFSIEDDYVEMEIYFKLT